MHLIRPKCLKKNFTHKGVPISFLPECGLHDKQRKTIGTRFPSPKRGMEAKISVAMPPTSSSGHVSKFYNKSRKQAIQL